MEELSPRDNRGDKIIPPLPDAPVEELMDVIVLPPARFRNAYLRRRYGEQVMWAMNKAEREDLYRAAVSGVLTPHELTSYPDEDEFDEDYAPEPIYTSVTGVVETVDLPPFDGDNTEAA